MQSVSRALLIGSSFLFLVLGRCAAQTNVTGVVVDEEGKPIRQVSCRISGYPLADGHRILQTGWAVSRFTDEKGGFALPVPRSDPLVELQFDHGQYAPVFLYDVRLSATPLKVVMTRGKELRGRVVDELGTPIEHAAIELQMPQPDYWYQRHNRTDDKGEFRFRISEPPQKHTWRLCYAGEWFTVDYEQVNLDTVIELRVKLEMRVVAEQTLRPTARRRRSRQRHREFRRPIRCGRLLPASVGKRRMVKR
ncbi:MAG TPA: hypothetical protein VJA21_30315 [Verrucomicrobiae bacterium]